MQIRGNQAGEGNLRPILVKTLGISYARFPIYLISEFTSKPITFMIFLCPGEPLSMKVRKILNKIKKKKLADCISFQSYVIYCCLGEARL